MKFEVLCEGQDDGGEDGGGVMELWKCRKERKAITWITWPSLFQVGMSRIVLALLVHKRGLWQALRALA